MERMPFYRKILLLLQLLSVSVVMVESSIGVNWGTVALRRLSPEVVVDLLEDNKITKVKLFDADPGVLKALAGSGIEVMVGIPNEMLSVFSTSASASDLWVSQNVSSYLGKAGVDIKYIAVGNEPFLTSYSGQFQSYVVPAVMNIQRALSKANLAGKVKIIVPCNADAYQATLPSQGTFRPDLAQIMSQLVSFLNSTGAPFFVNIYPFLSLYGSSDFPQDYAFFGGTAHPVIDGPNVYSNAFDGNLDTLVAALAKLGFGQMPIAVGEIGWPTDGAVSANITAARAFNQGLVDHVLSNKGTPLRPGVSAVDVYLFSLVDEESKSVLPGNFERHWGIFSFDGQSKYPLNLGNGRLKNAKWVKYLPSRWCVANSNRLNPSNLSTVGNHVRLACSYADCTTLNYGGSCNGIGEQGNISYAFNSYYQLQKQNPKSCDFDGLGMITSSNPSVGDCKFFVGVTESDTSGVSSFTGCGRMTSWLIIYWCLCMFLV